MVIPIILCDQDFQSIFNKEKIVYDLTRGQFKDKLKPGQDQLDLTKEISKLCWRILQAPDVFWDDDVKEVMAWYEKDARSGPEGKENFWPLWTVEDAYSWIKEIGCEVFKVYIFKNTNNADVYLKLADGRIVYEEGGILLMVLLKFVLKKLKGEYS